MSRMNKEYLEKHFAAAIKYNDILSVEQCIKKGVSLEYSPVFQDAPLLAAIRLSDSYEMIKLLIDYGANPLARSHFGLSNALHLAIENADYIYINKLDGYTKSGQEDDNLPYIEEYDLPHLASYIEREKPRLIDDVLEDYLKMIKLFLKKGVSLKDKDSLGDTPLHYIGRNEPLRDFLNAYISEMEN